MTMGERFEKIDRFQLNHLNYSELYISITYLSTYYMNAKEKVVGNVYDC